MNEPDNPCFPEIRGKVIKKLSQINFKEIRWKQFIDAETLNGHNKEFRNIVSQIALLTLILITSSLVLVWFIRFVDGATDLTILVYIP